MNMPEWEPPVKQKKSGYTGWIVAGVVAVLAIAIGVASVNKGKTSSPHADVPIVREEPTACVDMAAVYDESEATADDLYAAATAAESFDMSEVRYRLTNAAEHDRNVADLLRDGAPDLAALFDTAAEELDAAVQDTSFGSLDQATTHLQSATTAVKEANRTLDSSSFLPC